MPPADTVVDPKEPVERPAGGQGPVQAMDFSIDFQPASLPIIYIHGFLGSKLACGGSDKWPPTAQSSNDLLNLRLNPAGTANAAGTCRGTPVRPVP